MLEVSVTDRVEDRLPRDLKFVYDPEEGLVIEPDGDTLLADLIRKYPALLINRIGEFSLEEYAHWYVEQRGDELLNTHVSFGGIPRYEKCVVLTDWAHVRVGYVEQVSESGEYLIKWTDDEGRERHLEGRADGLVIARVRYATGTEGIHYWLIDTKRWLWAQGVIAEDGSPVGQALWLDPSSDGSIHLTKNTIQGREFLITDDKVIDLPSAPICTANELHWVPGEALQPIVPPQPG